MPSALLPPLVLALVSIQRRLPGLATTPGPRLDFQVENMDQKLVEELDVLNWPTLEKRSLDFWQEVNQTKLKMVYLKQGSALIGDGEQVEKVKAGQLVSISNGTVQWTQLSEGGVVILSIETSLDDEDDDITDNPQQRQEPESLKDVLVLLGVGILSGTVLAQGVKLFSDQ